MEKNLNIWQKFSLLLAVVMSGIFFCGGRLRASLPVAILGFYLFRKIVTPKAIYLLLLCIGFFPVFIALLQVAYFNDGYQSVDFAIFSQLIYQIVENNQFVTSLISTEWQNFITHHLSPYLIILGYISKFGISSQTTLIAAHVACVIGLVIGLFKLFSLFDEKRLITALLTVAAVLLPAVRIGLGWETHDELLALPFLIWSMYAHFSSQHRLKLLILLPTLLFKETLGLNIFGLSVFYALDDKASRFSSLITALTGLTTFILYTKVFPHWLWFPTFDGLTRVSSLDQLLSLSVLYEKALWLFTTLLPRNSISFFTHEEDCMAKLPNFSCCRV